MSLTRVGSALIASGRRRETPLADLRIAGYTTYVFSTSLHVLRSEPPGSGAKTALYLTRFI